MSTCALKQSLLIQVRWHAHDHVYSPGREVERQVCLRLAAVLETMAILDLPGFTKEHLGELLPSTRRCALQAVLVCSPQADLCLELPLS